MLLDNRKTRVIEVEVTQEDIDKATEAVRGTIWRAQNCAVSQALMRVFGGHWGTTHTMTHRYGGDDYRVMEAWDHDGCDMVYAFDRGRAVPGVVHLSPRVTR